MESPSPSQEEGKEGYISKNMATFSLGTSGVTPGAPGVYINEQAGLAANAAIADFSTVYMLVESEDTVPTTGNYLPFNTPVKISSLADYRRRLGGIIPTERIPLLSYNCVNEFFQNAQVGDLRVVRVGTPNQIVEIEFFPSGTKINSTSLPSNLQAGNIVYAQILINGQRLVSGINDEFNQAHPGFTQNGEWLGVPVEVPVNYVPGDEANNRKISTAMATAVAAAIESNPAIRSSVFVRSVGQTVDLNPSSNSETSFVTISAATYDANVSVVTQVLPVGSNFVFMQNSYDVENIVGQSTNLERVPQDYTQCIDTAFDGQQDQGYLITPTAYAQFDADGRAQVGAAAAAHCENNNYKWLALADPGPFLVTDVNKYQDYTPHQAAANLVTGLKYLVNNAIYEWTGTDVTYDKLTYQSIVFGENAGTAVNESANVVAANTKVGLLDDAIYTVIASSQADIGIFSLNTSAWWPVTLPIQKVTLTGAGAGNEFTAVDIEGGVSGVSLNGTEVYVIAPPFDLDEDSEYSRNVVFLATNPLDASFIYNSVVSAGGSSKITSAINGSVVIPSPTGDTAQVSYGNPYWDLPVTINGQTSDLIQNISGAAAGVNTLHLPGTLQDPTETYVLNWTSRTFYNPSTSIAGYTGTAVTPGAAVFTCVNHGLTTGQKIFFTHGVTVAGASLVAATTKLVSSPYWVRALTPNTFVIANSLGNFTAGNFIVLPVGTISSSPTIVYSDVLGRGLTTISSIEILTLPMVRGRKYAFDTNFIFNEAANAALAPGSASDDPDVSIFLNNSAVTLGEDQITPYGEDLSVSPFCGYLPKFNLIAPTVNPVNQVNNAYCVPTVDQFFQPEAYFVPAIESIPLGEYDGTVTGTIGPATILAVASGGTPTLPAGQYNNIPVSGGSGTGLTATITIGAGPAVTAAFVNNGGEGYTASDTGLTLPGNFGGATLDVTGINDADGSITAIASNAWAQRLAALGFIEIGDTAAQINTQQVSVAGGYFDVVGAGVAPNGANVVSGDRIALTYNGASYDWQVIKASTEGGDLTSVASAAYSSQVALTFTPEQTPPSSLWRFDAITSIEIIDAALRGFGFNGVPQAVFVEAGIDNVERLYDDSQRYFNPFGFIAYYGPWIENGSNVYIPPSPYVSGVAVRRYRAEGYQFPPAGVKYQLADAIGTQIPINSAQQNLLNPDGCNAIRTLPGYPTTAVFIWGGRTRVNTADAQQRLYQFVNTRVILNVVYGSLRTAFDSQIFNVIDGFGIVFNQIISVGNSVLNQLYVRGALFGARPADAFQVICDNRINTPESLENGIVNAQVFVTPVPTLERIQIDLIRVAIGQMQNELDIRGLGQTNQ